MKRKNDESRQLTTPYFYSLFTYSLSMTGRTVHNFTTEPTGTKRLHRRTITRDERNVTKRNK